VVLRALSDAEIESGLQKPGAGLPWYAHLYLRYYIGPHVAGKSDWEVETKRFYDTSAALLALAEKLDNGALQRRVLVPRLAGIEDSSRFWSAAMVLEHVMIVGMGMRDIILRLSQEKQPPGHVDTARVKPQGLLPVQTVLDNYKDFPDVVMGQIEKSVPSEKRDPQVRMVHPWFGPFTLRQWHWLLAEHNAIHLRQMQAIIAGL
jgi:hypothetical protein